MPQRKKPKPAPQVPVPPDEMLVMGPPAPPMGPPAPRPPDPDSPEGLLGTGQDLLGDIIEAGGAIPGLLKDIFRDKARAGGNRDEISRLRRKQN